MAEVVPIGRLGKYTLIKRLAAGGMAEILLARVSTLPGVHKLAVIKRILPEYADSTEFVNMFLDEARIASTLQHPNIVQTFDVGVIDGQYYLSMEYLQGENLWSVMQAVTRAGQRLPLDHGVAIVMSVCSGLHHAHTSVDVDGRALEIVHRDVTPQNVIVTYDGGIKLLDFGIAKARNQLGQTRHGTIKGKVPYMSPEQCRGEPLDRRSDVFSVGIMLWELTVGRRLFRGASDYEVLKQIVEGEVPRPSGVDASYDPALETIVMRALEKDRGRRFQSAEELQLELEQLVHANRLHISPIALTRFLGQHFSRKIEVLQKAQAEDDLETISRVAAVQMSPEVEEVEYDVTAPELRAGPLVRTPARPPAPRRARWAAAAGGAALIGLAALVWLSQRPATFVAPPAALPPAAPPPAPLATPPATVLPLPPLATPPATVLPSPPPATPRPTVPAPPAPALPSAKALLPAAHGSAHATRRSTAPAPAPAASSGEGVLLIGTNPWCRVSVDGRDRGETPLRLALPAGSHRVSLSNPQFGISRSLTVEIRGGETLRKNLDFGE